MALDSSFSHSSMSRGSLSIHSALKADRDSRTSDLLPYCGSPIQNFGVLRLKEMLESWTVYAPRIRHRRSSFSFDDVYH
ncbi:hypothetical protein P9112_001267 [Eukaryota sp. TZLM1-RC]